MEYEVGHIQGALLLPYEEFDDFFIDVSEKINTDTILITYCSGEECDLSINLAYELYDMGYKNILIFHGGWDLWDAKGYPVEGVTE